MTFEEVAEMTCYYSFSQYEQLKKAAEDRGEVWDLVLCSDGVMRTQEEADRFEASKSYLIQAEISYRPRH